MRTPSPEEKESEEIMPRLTEITQHPPHDKSEGIVIREGTDTRYGREMLDRDTVQQMIDFIS